MTKKQRNITIFILSFATALLVVFISFIYSNAFGLADFLYKNVPIIRRIMEGGSDEARLKLYEEFFMNFYKYPFGGMYQKKVFTETIFVHNLWLDIYSYGGIIPFTSFLAMNFYIVKDFLIKNNNNNNYKSQLLYLTILCAYVSISLFEPTIYASHYFFSLIFIFIGLLENKNNYVVINV